ncbi:uncharacterized protein SCHCODRAFT_02520680 [Schizophyllum commune H4-8]|uniref:CAP-Gly domain-containing protein n=1 Tax=Schizophyllum commune (strain H4-8 / FGSC 9210) TaxID=578458 RepID=D8PLZ8_SCHCM|nr:uncharacterized protein SCHCODRAFT_02489955 [Schizophyllum commune H4-8]XP_050197182.1 uncharacterized protein SCHCODRAFT_02520680 [Schizophyllum commune H4-8]KAI5885462.1 hypothetical protein SCHCODRAFT_02520680 [Schizophyllum commune H4-8]KAI5898979.1 hypothetical protein SCHCODRAFT_02489955 [Schizophyllum commune H4-8]
MSQEPVVGSIVEIPVGRGVVRFTGATSFSPGKWVGVQLYDAKGKNDGSVQGVQYFTCPMNYGVFVRPSQVKATSRLGPGSPAKRASISLQPRKSLSLKQSPPGHEPSLSREPSGSRRPPASPVLSRHQTSSPLITQTPLLATTPPRTPSPPIPTIRPGSRSSSPINNATPPQPPPDDTELQELRAKLRVLEAKRGDDSRHIRELETRLAEAESFVALRPKLQAKLNQLQTELIETRRELADAQQLSQLNEGRNVDNQEQLEMAMLDKEMAEERAELAEAELEEVRERLAAVEVELTVRREENGDAIDTEAGKDTLAFIQLEKQNERLKEALIRLRDVTQETDQEQRKRLAELEKDLAGFEELQTSYETTLIQLTNAEIQVEDLKMQLDDALGAEEMLVKLTERNLELGEKIEDMRITIEDLEALKELNDELEENHVETEKALNEDLEKRDMEIQELKREVERYEEACQDLEGTISQFRELVLNLQSELDTLRTQTQTAQDESANAASQTAAVMSLNMKLQSSASKNQAKHIELEIKRLEARESKELLEIVQPFLPQLYVEQDSLSISCYLFFLRLSYKADLVSSVTAQAHGLPDSLHGTVSDVLVGVCEMRGRLSALSILCRRFAAIMRCCDVETFLNIGRIFPDIAPMEKRLDMHVDLLRRDEFRVRECVSDILKMQAQFDHLAETYFEGFPHDLGERQLGYVSLFDHDLDMFLGSMGLIKTTVNAVLKDDEITFDMGGYDIDAELFTPMQKLLDQIKPAKNTARKLVKRFEDLTQDSNAVKSAFEPRLKVLSNSVPELVNFGFALAQQIMPHLKDAQAGKSPFQLTTIIGFVKQSATSTAAKGLKPGVSVWDALAEPITQLVQESSNLLTEISEPSVVTKVTGIAPWITRVEQIKASLAVNVEADRKLAQVSDEMQGLVRNIKAKDQHIQEAAVKIELMERRMEAAKRQADMVVDLEAELAKARKEKQAYDEAMEQLQTDLDALEQENAKLKAQTAAGERQASGPQQPEMESVPVEGSLETSYLLEQVDALRGTVRFLRTENSFLKGQDLLREIEALPQLDSVSRMSTPPLDPSSSSDEDSDDDYPRTPPTMRSLAVETKLLYRDVIKFSSSPRVVDLSKLNARRTEAKTGRVWLPRKETPAYHIMERKREAEALSRRVRGLLERASGI